MRKTFPILLISIIIGLSSAAAAQQMQQQNQNQTMAVQVEGECVMQPQRMNDTETPFMTCQFTRSTDQASADSRSLMDQMIQRMQELMRQNQTLGDRGQEQGQGMNGMGGMNQGPMGGQ